MKALLLPLLLLAADEPRYPVPLSTPDLTAPGHPFVLSDLRYRMTHDPGMRQAFAARVRVGTWGFLGGFVDDQRRGLSLQTQRLELGYFDDGSFTNFSAGFRGARLLLDVEAERRPPQDGGGFSLDAEVGARLSPDVEAFASAFADTDRRRALPARKLSTAGLGLLWQRGTRLDLSANVSRSERRTEAGFELESLRASASGAGYAWNGQARGEIAYERTRGLLPRSEAFASAAFEKVVAGRWLAEAHSSNRWEPGVLWFEHELGGGVSLHARRVRLSRAGEAAARTLALARRASALGYNERRVYDDDGRRALRERLALSPRRHELAPELQALHPAQVAERRVPLAGAAASESVDRVLGTRRLALDVFLGVPWPAGWPWQANEASVPFLRARYSRGRNRYDGGFSSTDHSAALEAELNREMTLALRWRRPALTPIDVIRRTGGGRSWEVEYVYARGR